jgi:hypothetical protein
MQLQDFPSSVARVLRQLTSLNLQGNQFLGLPASLILITTLQEIFLHKNVNIQLVHEDVNFLARLPHLRQLSILSSEDGVDENVLQRNASMLLAIQERLPLLDLPGFRGGIVSPVSATVANRNYQIF